MQEDQVHQTFTTAEMVIYSRDVGFCRSGDIPNRYKIESLLNHQTLSSIE